MYSYVNFNNWTVVIVLDHESVNKLSIYLDKFNSFFWYGHFLPSYGYFFLVNKMAQKSLPGVLY